MKKTAVEKAIIGESNCNKKNWFYYDYSMIYMLFDIWNKSGIKNDK
jgi:hypothetical protein